MSEYCPKCGEKTSEDDGRLCANCQAPNPPADATKTVETPPPTGAPVPWDKIEASGLRWALCGGLHVGHTVQPRVWLLRPKDETDRERQRAKDLQRMAAMARTLARVLEWCEMDSPDFELDADAIRRVLYPPTTKGQP